MLKLEHITPMNRTKNQTILKRIDFKSASQFKHPQVTYAAAKGGVIAFTKKSARELGPYGITVNAIAPNTTLTERIRPRWEQQSPESQARQIEQVPLRRMAEALDQARVICFFASSDADYVTGQTIDVSGGLV